MRGRYAKQKKLTDFECSLNRFSEKINPFIEKISQVCRIKLGQHQARLLELQKRQEKKEKAKSKASGSASVKQEVA